MVRPEIQTRVTIAAVVSGLLVAAGALVAWIVLMEHDHGPVGVVLTYAIDDQDLQRSSSSVMSSLVRRLNERLRSIGDARSISSQRLEVEIYGNPNTAEFDSIKRLISGQALLEFRILADPRVADNRSIIELAKRGRDPAHKDVLLVGTKVAEWVAYSPAELGPVDEEIEGVVKRNANGTPEVLVMADSANVTGEFLTTATKKVDEQNQRAIHFSVNRDGAARFAMLTSQNLPNMGAPNVRRKLGIILDKRLLCAPAINTTISDRGMISGGSMSDREVDDILTILNTGSLPCEIRLVDEKRVTEK